MELRCKFAKEEHGTFSDPRTLGKHYQTEHGVAPKAVARRRCLVCGQQVSAGGVNYHFKTHHPDQRAATVPEGTQVSTNGEHHSHDENECTLCGHRLPRKSMGSHFFRKHPGMDWKLHVRRVDDAPSAVLALAESLPPVHEFAAHEDGNGYVADDFFLPVVAQLAHPGGNVPVDAMPVLMAYRDATTLMLVELAAMRRKRMRR